MQTDETNADGEAVEEWAEAEHLTLIQDAKLPKSFNSGRWKKGFTLTWHLRAPTSPISAAKLFWIPYPEHNIAQPFQRCFNFNKANCHDFSAELEEQLDKLEPSSPNYYTIAGLV